MQRVSSFTESDTAEALHFAEWVTTAGRLPRTTTWCELRPFLNRALTCHALTFTGEKVIPSIPSFSAAAAVARDACRACFD